MKLWIIHLVSNVPRTILKRTKKKMKMTSMNLVLNSVASAAMSRMTKATPLVKMMETMTRRMEMLNMMMSRLIQRL